MCKLRDVGRINHNNAFLLKQGFGLLDYLYSEFGPAAVKLVDKDDGSFGYLGQMALYELANFAPKLFSALYCSRKSVPLKFSMMPLMSTPYPIMEAAVSMTLMTPLPKSFPPLTLCSSTALAIEANYRQDRIVEMVVFPCVEINGEAWCRGEFCCGFS